MRDAVRLLITGATGFLGINLVHDFSAAGAQVVAIDRRQPTDRQREYVIDAAHAVDWRVCDVRDRHAMEAIFTGGNFDAIVHSAAITPSDESIEAARAVEVFDVNLCAGIHLCQLAIEKGVRRTILVGSGAAMGQRPIGESCIAEDATGRPVGLYGIAKLALEQSIARLRDLSGTDIVVARIAQPFGPMELATPDRLAISPIGEWMHIAQSGQEIVVSATEIARDWIYIRDLTRAFQLLVEADRTSTAIYNLGPGRRTSVRQVIDAIIEAWPTTRVCVDPSANYNRNLRPEALRPMLDTRRFADEFGFSPLYTVEDGIAETAHWMQSHAADAPQSNGLHMRDERTQC